MARGASSSLPLPPDASSQKFGFGLSGSGCSISALLSLGYFCAVHVRMYHGHWERCSVSTFLFGALFLTREPASEWVKELRFQTHRQRALSGSGGSNNKSFNLSPHFFIWLSIVALAAINGAFLAVRFVSEHTFSQLCLWPAASFALSCAVRRTMRIDAAPSSNAMFAVVQNSAKRIALVAFLALASAIESTYVAIAIPQLMIKSSFNYHENLSYDSALSLLALPLFSALLLMRAREIIADLGTEIRICAKKSLTLKKANQNQMNDSNSAALRCVSAFSGALEDKGALFAALRLIHVIALAVSLTIISRSSTAPSARDGVINGALVACSACVLWRARN